MCYPLLDHLINGTDVTFDKYGKTIHLMYGLIPSVTAEREVDIKDTIEQYKDDLPMPDNTMEEFSDGKEDGALFQKMIVRQQLLLH